MIENSEFRFQSFMRKIQILESEWKERKRHKVLLVTVGSGKVSKSDKIIKKFIENIISFLSAGWNLQ